MNVLSRILVATDYSPCGGAAVARAGQLAGEHHAELRVIHVSPDWNLFSRSLPAQQAHYASLTQHAEGALQHDVEWVQRKFSIRARGDIYLGNASQTILRAVAEYQPHLLVIGSRGEHGPMISPSGLGGTALKLIAETTVPMLIARNTDASHYQEALLAVSDAGDLSRRIVEWGVTVAPHAVRHLVHAYDVPYLERLRHCGIDDATLVACATQSRAGAQRAMDELLKVSSTRIQTHLMPGEPLNVVLTQIIRDRAQLLVIGKHAESITESDHALVGSVGLRLAYHAQVDVLVVP
jgi:nucleotide-binding universal stress UspA family protein